MDPMQIINKYRKYNSDIYKILLDHSKKVTKKAIEIAKNNLDKNPDLKFIEEAAMLHDIGLCKTKNRPYILHGLIGSEMLKSEGFPRHANVCRTHIGAGITKEDVTNQKIPLPVNDYIPKTTEEQIICLADKFYTKSKPHKEKTVKQIREDLKKFGDKTVKRFDELCKKYKVD